MKTNASTVMLSITESVGILKEEEKRYKTNPDNIMIGRNI